MPSFAMGDNSTDSLDGRSWGFVPENEIIGESIMLSIIHLLKDGGFQSKYSYFAQYTLCLINALKQNGYHSEQLAGFCTFTSLPSDTGVGNLGGSAYSFISFLENAGFQFWQMCPVGPTGFGDSPYQVFSSFAGNPYLIDWKPIQDQNLILNSELQTLQKPSKR